MVGSLENSTLGSSDGYGRTLQSVVWVIKFVIFSVRMVVISASIRVVVSRPPVSWHIVQQVVWILLTAKVKESLT